MASLQVSSLISSSSCSQKPAMLQVKSAIHVPNLPRSAPKLPLLPTTNTLLQELNNDFTHSSSVLPIILQDYSNNVNPTATCSSKSKATIIMHQLYAILEAVSDRVEMHHNVGEQRNNWNTLLLNSINMITLTATAMCAMAAASGAAAAPILALKLSSALLFSAATGMVVIMNKIQPSQLAEEQRNATRLFKQLEAEIETIIALGNPTKEDVKRSMRKVLALDKAYPLPLLGAMVEKFPRKFEAAVWWPSSSKRTTTIRFRETKTEINNGWDKGLEMEMREVVEVIKKKDVEDYERLGNLVLKINKTLAIAGPLLTGIAAVGSCFVTQGSWASVVPLMAGALATAVNAFEHGGQVGMVAEIYRSTAGFFRQTQDWIQETIEEEIIEERENGELFEMKLALKLGRSLSQLRDLAAKSAYSRKEGTPIDEFASKIF